MIVFSTWKSESDDCVKRCRESVKTQSLPTSHAFLFGDEPILSKMYRYVGMLPPDEVVIWLDGDDWLMPWACEVVNATYSRHNPWLTYGQFVWSDGRPGFAYQSIAIEGKPWKPRRLPWFATHLKTFRAGLFQQIKREDLMNGGDWLEPTDMAVMFPMLEMAGFRRSLFIPNILMTYTGNGGDKNQEEYIRALPSYPLLTEHPW